MSTVQRFAKILATGLGSGTWGIAPGSIGSVVFFVGWLGSAIYFELNQRDNILISLAILILALCSTAIYMRAINANVQSHHDPQEVVIDEWAGLSLTLSCAPNLEWFTLILAFLLFRLFDILKPVPVCTAEKLPGALGVVADDIVAGIYAGGLLLIGSQFGLI